VTCGKIPDHQEEFSMLNKILVAFDGSDQSYKAFDFALEMSWLSDASPEITVLSVVQPPELAGIVKEDSSLFDSAITFYEHLFKGLREKADKKNLKIKTEVITGHPAHEIIEYAAQRKSDMIIVGQRGKSQVAQWLLGSVSKRISTYAPCTVTIVK
jgi:nucleotide-binding universal stress UspA family protein